ncbi:MAG: DotU family type IV/VI secretion system protein [Fibrobacter sp.]|nr:DotU family type IV/VI secretion system protein [Fibrobacter sp.]
MATVPFTETISAQTLNLSSISDTSRSLAALCTDLLLIAIKMREAEDLGEPSALRKLINYYLELFIKNCKLSGVDDAAVLDTQYALVSLLDETVLSSPGVCRNYWISRPLQLDIFGNNIAGEEFYRRLNHLLVEPAEKNEVLEVYYLCLCLGFEGKYKISGTAERLKIIEHLGLKICSTQVDFVNGISPHGLRTFDIQSKRHFFLFPIWIAASVLIMIIAAIWIVLDRAHNEHIDLLMNAFEKMVEL